VTNAPVFDASAMITKVFGNMHQRANTTPTALEGKSILTINNNDVDELNERALDMFPGEATEFLSLDKAEDPMKWPEELLNKQQPKGLPQHRLRLKEGCPIMLLRNLNLTKGLVNGARFVITHIGNYSLKCKFIGNEDRRGEEVCIPRIHLRSEDGKHGFGFLRRQFPIRLAFSMTVNKVLLQTRLPICSDITLTHTTHTHFNHILPHSGARPDAPKARAVYQQGGFLSWSVVRRSQSVW
jgi:ATP-dependent DNA helicase PIF1